MDFLELAKKHLRSLELLWLYIMTLGSIAFIFAGLSGEANSLPLINYAIPTLFLFLCGIAGVPFLITKAIPVWNLWTPWKDRKTIWETELIVFVITLTSLAWTSSCFFGLNFWYAVKIQILLGMAASPILWITARQRWKTHLLETPKLKGVPDESAVLTKQEYEIRRKKNIAAYLVAALAATLVQSTALIICLLLIGKTAAYIFLPSLVMASFVINLIIPPIGVGLAKRWTSSLNLRPSANFFIGTTLFSIGSVAVPYIFMIIGKFRTRSLHQLEFGSYENSIAIVVSTFIIGYLIGALCFGKLYQPASQSSNFI